MVGTEFMEGIISFKGKLVGLMVLISLPLSSCDDASGKSIRVRKIDCNPGSENFCGEITETLVDSNWVADGWEVNRRDSLRTVYSVNKLGKPVYSDGISTRGHRIIWGKASSLDFSFNFEKDSDEIFSIIRGTGISGSYQLGFKNGKVAYLLHFKSDGYGTTDTLFNGSVSPN